MKKKLKKSLRQIDEENKKKATENLRRAEEERIFRVQVGN